MHKIRKFLTPIKNAIKNIERRDWFLLLSLTFIFTGIYLVEPWAAYTVDGLLLFLISYNAE